MTQEHFEILVDKGAELDDILDDVNDFDEFTMLIRSAINNWCNKKEYTNTHVMSEILRKEKAMLNEMFKLRK